MGASKKYTLFMVIYCTSNGTHWTLFIEDSSILHGADRFHAYCEIESKLDSGSYIPKEAPDYHDSGHPIRERFSYLPDGYGSSKQVEIGQVDDIVRLRRILRTHEEDRNKMLSSCYHWVRNTVERLEDDPAVNASAEQWRETRQLLESGPNIHLNIEDSENLGLDIQRRKSTRPNYMSQQRIIYQGGMSAESADGVSIDGIDIDNITHQSALNHDRISVDDLSPGFRARYGLYNIDQSRVNHELVDVNINSPRQSSDADNQNRRKRKAKRQSSTWCCFS
ncbi:hypothetical protein BDV26DRAFT_287171 [Aspergillus bertholletiae]|uniref:Uncharacterized protein n=1 Tax=Aspergillus bertholletiae TaxID=1226010 RepID=A0A5N7BPQ4_9EURO|nr:hypothetical protein BDV26DRAFT_287171 [Aspergillus bertholletiae]